MSNNLRNYFAFKTSSNYSFSENIHSIISNSQEVMVKHIIDYVEKYMLNITESKQHITKKLYKANKQNG